ncbi:MFS transporter [Eubacteriales bacterium OttesenSCG-928-A19]|nr:MFS transporter [Eubacteriales bacterium OttesenSCG-928-A19]
MKNIVFLGLVSFFTDLSTEMVYPLIPLYLTSVFGATPAIVGIIEGIAESVASLLKVFSGYVTDRLQKKKALAATGYATGLLYKVALVLAGSWVGVLAARVIDRLGKGIRTAPRDVLISESADKKSLGKSFGWHKMLDMAGAAAGILITYFLLAKSDGAYDYKRLFLLSMIPAILGLCMFFFIREEKQAAPVKERVRFWKNLCQMNRQLKLYLVIVAIFTLGNSSNAFLLLKAKSTGFSDTNVVLLYFVFNLTASTFAIPFGKLSDRLGRKKLLVAGYLLFAVCYVGFAFASSRWQMVAVFILYGLYTAASSGAERAFVVEIAPLDMKGTMLGLQSTVTGILLLPASVIAGLLWDAFGATATFGIGAALSVVAAVLLMVFLKPINTEEDATPAV